MSTLDQIEAMLMGPDGEEQRARLAALGLTGVEPPSYLARIGRGMADMGETMKQGYLNVYGDPGQAQQYQQQTGAVEAIYQRGLLAANPEWQDPDPGKRLTAGLIALLGSIGAALQAQVEPQLWDEAAGVLRYLDGLGILPDYLK